MNFWAIHESIENHVTSSAYTGHDQIYVCLGRLSYVNRRHIPQVEPDGIGHEYTRRLIGDSIKEDTQFAFVDGYIRAHLRPKALIKFCSLLGQIRERHSLR